MLWVVIAVVAMGAAGAWYWRERQARMGPQSAIAAANGWTYHTHIGSGEAGKRARMHYYSGVIAQGASWHAHTQPLSKNDGGVDLTIWKCAEAASPQKVMAIGPTNTPPRPSVSGHEYHAEALLSPVVRRLLDRNTATMPPKVTLGELPWDQEYVMVSDDPFLPFQVISPWARREMTGETFLHCRLEAVLCSAGLILRLEHPAHDLDCVERLVHLGEMLSGKVLESVTPQPS